MTPERTELEWIYQPADFFEAPFRYLDAEYSLLLEAGRAVATLLRPRNPVEMQLLDRIGQQVQTFFLVRQLQTHTEYTLEGPRICQREGGKNHFTIQAASASVNFAAGLADMIVRDQSGTVVRDTRAERIAEQTSMLDDIAPKVERSSTLSGMLLSHSRSLKDPANALVHLYEIRDGLKRHYGSESKARKALNISKAEWQRIGLLADVEPLTQGRHRGRHYDAVRPASEQELNEAREIVKRWIFSFARLI
jgi:hypothetical protein